jgi:tRNA dimethylallyltransferase
MPRKDKRLLAVVGPTAAGKTDAAVFLAQHFQTEIISADSRQFYRELNVGVARPSRDQLTAVPHHFVGFRGVAEPYSAGQYASDVLMFLDDFFTDHSLVILVGGSGLYVRAVCHGFDDALPPSGDEVRSVLNQRLETEGLAPLLEELKGIDPQYYATADRRNPRRILRALEVWQITGKPYSSFRSNKPEPRPFETLKVGLTLPVKELRRRITDRVDMMIENGLVDEARSLMPFRHLSALQTVGYQELFEHFDGQFSLEEAIDLIKTNSVQFAKRQMTWWRKEKGVEWYSPGQWPDIVSRVERWLGS